MKIITYIISVLTTVTLLSCNRAGLDNQGEPVAKVGDKKLYLSDLQSLFTTGMEAEDSVKLLESYVDMWVKKELKVQEAEKLFAEGNNDIEKMVSDYRNSLLSHKIDQYYVDRSPDSLFDDNAIAEYYNNHKNDFLLDRTIARGVVVRLQDKYRQKKQLKELMVASGDKYQDFIEISNKNQFEVWEYDTWTDLSEILSHLPAKAQMEADKLLSEKGVSEFKDGSDEYFIYIRSSLLAGDVTPLERVKDNIERVLFTQRKQEIIKNYEDSLYKAAVGMKAVEINIK